MRWVWSTHGALDSSWLLDAMNFANLRCREGLHVPRRPTNDHLLNVRVFAQTEVHAALILRRESATPRHLLHLLLALPEQPYLCANCAAVADAALQLKGDPLVVRRDAVLVQQQRAFLVGDQRIKHAAIPQIGE